MYIIIVILKETVPHLTEFKYRPIPFKILYYFFFKFYRSLIDSGRNRWLNIQRHCFWLYQVDLSNGRGIIPPPLVNTHVKWDHVYSIGAWICKYYMKWTVIWNFRDCITNPEHCAGWIYWLYIYQCLTGQGLDPRQLLHWIFIDLNALSSLVTVLKMFGRCCMTCLSLQKTGHLVW